MRSKKPPSGTSRQAFDQISSLIFLQKLFQFEIGAISSELPTRGILRSLSWNVKFEISATRLLTSLLIVSWKMPAILVRRSSQIWFAGFLVNEFIVHLTSPSHLTTKSTPKGIPSRRNSTNSTLPSAITATCTSSEGFAKDQEEAGF